MSFDTIKNYVDGRMQGLGYIESKMPFDFEGEASTAMDKSFIFVPQTGEIDPDGDNLNISVFDKQVWQLSIHFKKSEHNDIINRDDMYRSIEAIIVDLDNSANFEGTVDYIRYSGWEVQEESTYFLLNIKFDIQDRYTY